MKSYKKDFPIFKNDKSLVYLDSAATSQKPKAVIDSIVNYYEAYNANIMRGLYPISERATKEVEEVREKVARFINARAKEIIFVRNTTEAINLAANCFASHNIKRGDYIFSTITEHHANFVPWQQIAKKYHANFGVLDINDNFQFLISNSQKELRKAKILAITHVSNVLGIINPIEEIIKTVRKINPKIKILVDGAQSVPHLEIDVQKINCDFLAFSGHKMMAGTGIGVLYAKKELLDEMPPFLFGGEMIKEVNIKETSFADFPSKFEAGTPDISGIISLGKAIDYLESIGMENIRKHDLILTEYCLEELKKIKGIKIYSTKEIKNKIGVISFTIEGIHSHDMGQILANKNICVRSGHHCTMPLHKKLGIQASTRVSFYLYNDLEDINKFIEGIKRVKKIFE